MSFAGPDRKEAEQLAKKLKSKVVRVFLNQDHFPELWGEGGEKFAEKIYGNESRHVIPLISTHYLECDTQLV